MLNVLKYTHFPLTIRDTPCAGYDIFDKDYFHIAQVNNKEMAELIVSLLTKEKLLNTIKEVS